MIDKGFKPGYSSVPDSKTNNSMEKQELYTSKINVQ